MEAVRQSPLLEQRGGVGRGLHPNLVLLACPGEVRDVIGSLPPGVWKLYTPETYITLLANATPIN